MEDVPVPLEEAKRPQRKRKKREVDENAEVDAIKVARKSKQRRHVRNRNEDGEVNLDDYRSWGDDKATRGKRLLRNIVFSPEENSSLVKAMHELSLEKGVDFEDLQESLKEDGMRGTERAVRYMWARLAKLTGLEHRSVNAIQKRIRRLLQDQKGEWSKEEAEKLQELVGKHGQKWKDIAVELGCSREHARDKWRKFPLVSGRAARLARWTELEVWALRQGVLEATDKLAPVKDVPWPKVARYVLTRGPFSCMQKWYCSVLPELLEYRDKHGYAIPPEVFQRHLVRRLKKSKLGDIHFVNWTDINKWWPAWKNRRTWRSLTLRYLPADLDLDPREGFREQVNYLHDALGCRDQKVLDKKLLRHARNTLEAEAAEEALSDLD